MKRLQTRNLLTGPGERLLRRSDPGHPEKIGLAGGSQRHTGSDHYVITDIGDVLITRNVDGALNHIVQINSVIGVHAVPTPYHV